MKTHVSWYEFSNSFNAIRPDNFSYAGLRILFDYLEELEDDMGEEIEFDVIAICCDYVEDDYETIRDSYGIPLSFAPEDYPEVADYNEALAERIIEYLENRGVFVADIDGTCCVYRQF